MARNLFKTASKLLNLPICLILLSFGCYGCNKPIPQAPASPAPAPEANIDKCRSADRVVTCLRGVCNPASGECVECLASADCREAEKPICAERVCYPCSNERPCAAGICREGRCQECVTDDDCHDRQKGLCVEGQCVSCTRDNCAESCDELSGKCRAPVARPCPGGRCGVPGPISDIDPNTIALVNVLDVFIIHLRDLYASEKPLEIGTYSVDARVNGLFATVSTEFTVFNPNSRTFEGELEFPLPDSAVVSGYAIDVGGVLTPAQVVEKQKARIAFENEVKKGIDPGLVEQVKGNMYRTRIYPITAGGTRRVRVEYITPLTIAPNGDAALALPMPKTKLKERNVTITVAAAGVPAPVVGGLGDQSFLSAEAVWRLERHDRDITPEENILMAMPHLPDTIISAELERGDIFFAASVKVAENRAASEQMAKNWRLIWDASGSRTAKDIEKARRLLNELPERASYELHVFRNELEAPQKFSTRAELTAAIDGLAYDGGTSFAPLMAIAAQKFNGPTLFFSDGLDTMEGAVPEFGAGAVALISGGARDLAAMRRICGGRAINLDIVESAEAMRQILAPPLVVSALNGAGISDVQGIGLAASGRVTVLGRLQNPGVKGELVFSDGRKVALDFPADGIASGKTLATAWAARRVEELSPRADDNREELLALGRRFSLVSPVSSMIVFERLSQWLEYDIEPPAALSEMHAEWLKQRPSEAQKEEEERRRAENWLNNLKKAWQERIKWWENPIPPKSEWKEEGGNDRARAAGRAAPRAARARESAPMAMAYEDGAAPMAEAEPLAAGGLNRKSKAAGGGSSSSSAQAAAVSMTVRAWDPDTPYLRAIKDAKKVFKTAEAIYKEYLHQRATYAASPAFFLDCAGLFFKEHEERLAVRILSNLSEMKIDDPALLRVYAWRLREAGALEAAITVLNKVAKLRADEAVSWRDLALTHAMLAKKNMSAEDTGKALEYFHKTAFTPWRRNDAMWTALVALEEFNELLAWSNRQKWAGNVPSAPAVEDLFRKVLDTDMRIVMMWDADSTDIDMHVKEPSGEEVYYGHKRSKTGGLVSHDVTTGYGPEEFLHKTAPKGRYDVFTKYFASHQQNLIGPATITLMMYTNWGRESQKSEIVSLRLEKAKDKVIVGSMTVE